MLSHAIRTATLERLRAPGKIDAIVVGSGATGGLAAQLLTDEGLQVLVLDAGVPRSRVGAWRRRMFTRAVRSLLGDTAVERIARRRQPIQSQCYAWSGTPDAFVDDRDCPYTTPEHQPFVWLRSRQLGGRMTIPGHGRQYYRLAEADFNPPDGRSEPWPLEAQELDQWYAKVERQLALAGRYDDNPWVPDSELIRELELSTNEIDLIRAVVTKWPHAKPILGRFGAPLPSLELAARTNRLRVRRGAIVRELNVDASGRVCGVTWIDVQGRTEVKVSAPLVFLAASALESTRLLMLSRSARSPLGLGGASGVLGRNLMDHIRIRVSGYGPPLEAASPFETGRCVYLPRFDARANEAAEGRGFGIQMYRTARRDGRSNFSAGAFGEMLPRLENRVSLDEARRDAWGVPVLHIDCVHSDEDRARASQQVVALRELAEVVGAQLTVVETEPAPPGSANHECGTARMGRDPATSVFDPNNECWDARGLYLTDGACLPSQGMQNPTLTLLALTARACAHALQERAGSR